MEQRREMFRFHDQFTAASNLYHRITATSTDIEGLADVQTARLSALSNDVEAVTGERFVLPDRPGRPQDLQDEAPASEDKAPDNEGDGSDDANEEELDAQDDERETPLPRDSDRESMVAASTELPEIVQEAKSVVNRIYELQALAETAQELVASADSAYARVRSARMSSDLVPITTELTRIDERMAGLRSQADALISSMRPHVSQIERLHRAHEIAAAAEARRQREAEARRQAELERQREAEAHQRRIDADMALVNETGAALKVMHARHAYSEGLEAVEAATERLQTREGRDAMQVLQDRYRMLYELKGFLIQRLTEHPYEWGWRQDGDERDILGASPEGVQVRGWAEPVPWDRVSAGQMLRMIEYCLSHRATRASQRMTQYMATAIYCYETGGDRGLELARRFLNQALNARYPQRDATRLLPID